MSSVKTNQTTEHIDQEILKMATAMAIAFNCPNCPLNTSRKCHRSGKHPLNTNCKIRKINIFGTWTGLILLMVSLVNMFMCFILYQSLGW